MIQKNKNDTTNKSLNPSFGLENLSNPTLFPHCQPTYQPIGQNLSSDWFPQALRPTCPPCLPSPLPAAHARCPRARHPYLPLQVDVELA